MQRKLKTGRWLGLPVLLLLVALAACGETTSTAGPTPAGAAATATPIPTFTPAPTAPPQPAMLTTQAISGTITEVDPAARTLSLQDSSGKLTKYSLEQAIVSKSEKLSSEEFSKALNPATFVELAGEKGPDGVIAARSLTLLLDMAGGGVFVGGPGGKPVEGAVSPGALTPGATPSANQVIGANGTPGASPPPGKSTTFMVGDPDANTTLLKNAKLENNLLSGDSLAGSPVKASLGAATGFSRRVKGDLPDLKAGQSVTLAALPAEGDKLPQAMHVTIN